jgi:hypothetical protein
MTVTARQLVVLANGEVRIPDAASQVAHGHRAPDEVVKIVVPAGKSWVLVEVQIEAERVQAQSPFANRL